MADPPAGVPFRHELRVRYGECDAQGVVFNSHYLAWTDVAITELFRAAFGSYAGVVERGVDIVVAEARLRFRAAGRFDDRLELGVLVTHLGRTSMSTRHTVHRDGDLLAETDLRHVWVDARTLAKTAIPEWARAGLAPWTVLEAYSAGSGSLPGQAPVR